MDNLTTNCLKLLIKENFWCYKLPVMVAKLNNDGDTSVRIRFPNDSHQQATTPQTAFAQLIHNLHTMLLLSTSDVKTLTDEKSFELAIECDKKTDEITRYYVSFRADFAENPIDEDPTINP